jgi:hypothetical protein
VSIWLRCTGLVMKPSSLRANTGICSRCFVFKYITTNVSSESYLDLIPVQKNLQGGSLDYHFDLEKSVRLAGGHGEEIVRDIFTDVHVTFPNYKSEAIVTNALQAHTTYTCGEDGHVRAWKFSGEEDMDIDDEAESAPQKLKDKKDRKEKRKEKKEKRKGDGERFKPY